MAASITVDPQKLEAASQQISTKAAEYESIVTHSRLYSYFPYLG